MKAVKKTLLVLSLILLLVIVGIPFTYFLNKELVFNGVDKVLTRTGYDFDRLGFSEVSQYLKKKYPPGTKRSEVREQFRDCDTIYSQTLTEDDSLRGCFEEDYAYKLGFWGTLEIRTVYDSLSQLKIIDYYYESDKYDY